MKNPANQKSLTFPARSVNEGFARAAVAAFAAQLDPTIEELSDIKTAVSEGVTNCIVHAYPDQVGMVTVIAAIDGKGGIEIKIRDRGCGIPDVEAARAPMFTTGGAERSGMGFTIMESFMDRCRVRSAPGKGTLVTLYKQLAPRASGRRTP